jgi:hypothetical protein
MRDGYHTAPEMERKHAAKQHMCEENESAMAGRSSSAFIARTSSLFRYDQSNTKKSCILELAAIKKWY